MKIKWLKLHRFIEDNIKGGLDCLSDFECLDDEYNSFQYRLYVQKDIFDDGDPVLITAILGMYDIESEIEHDPSIFQMPSTMINNLHCFVNQGFRP
ncbi:hypothetical protein [Paenibacillus naphthalenovorans]|uniref:hypothetical protein n=1 Tax=Paenibacillus naphthalenovorans TaxID=162209 RepID=UPI000880528F|nr:hypothetical protein [Paenibacillus naphthalenovorans]SDJ44044.1 hypothetical protein SAMN05421868_12738 [Paenibacillus naphthalenovorans]